MRRSLRSMNAVTPLAGLLLILLGCAEGESPSRPREDSELQLRPPVVEVAGCTALECGCTAQGYERCESGVANFVAGYAGSGSRPVTFVSADDAPIHIWPANDCGEAMAASLNCDCVPGHVRHPEMSARELLIYPGQAARLHFLPYYAHQTGRPVVYIDPDVEEVSLLAVDF